MATWTDRHVEREAAKLDLEEAERRVRNANDDLAEAHTNLKRARKRIAAASRDQ